LGELVVDGIETTSPLFTALLDNPDILAGDYDIHWLEAWLEQTFS
jgi:acetyl-CoA carboxylase biotin carboxylase subunit